MMKRWFELNFNKTFDLIYIVCQLKCIMECRASCYKSLDFELCNYMIQFHMHYYNDVDQNSNVDIFQKISHPKKKSKIIDPEKLESQFPYIRSEQINFYSKVKTLHELTLPLSCGSAFLPTKSISIFKRAKKVLLLSWLF